MVAKLNPVYLIAGGAVIAALLWQKTSAATIGKSLGGGAVDLLNGVLTGAAEAVPDEVNPASDKNIIYSTISKAGQSVTGNSGWTLGGLSLIHI